MNAKQIESMHAWKHLESAWNGLGYLRNNPLEGKNKDWRLKVANDTSDALCDMQCDLEVEWLDDLCTWFQNTAVAVLKYPPVPEVEEGGYPWHRDIGYMIDAYLYNN